MRRIKRLVAPADADPAYLCRRFHADGPVFRYRERGRRVVAVVGIERSRALLDEAGGALEPWALPFSKLIPRGHLRYMSGRDHERYRRVLAPALSVETCHAHVETIRGAWRAALGSCSGSHGRIAGALQDAAHGILALLAVGEEAAPRLAALLPRLPVGRSPILRRRMHRQTVTAAVGLLDAVPADAPTFWARARSEAGDLREDPTLPRTLVYTLRLGAIDLAGLLHWVLDELARNPRWASRCGERAVAAAVVEETLRLHRTESLYRRATSSVRSAEVDVPRGAFLRVCVAESHRDPLKFADPNRFDPVRFLSGRPPPSAFQPFGRMPSRCLGAAITLFLATLFVEETSRWRIELTADRGPVHDGFHWQPGSAVRMSA